MAETQSGIIISYYERFSRPLLADLHPPGASRIATAMAPGHAQGREQKQVLLSLKYNL